MATMQMSVRPEDLSQVPKGHERIPDPGILVIFGASGDLTKRKLLPALFHLRQADLLPKTVRHCGRGAAAAGRRVCGGHARGHRGVWRRRLSDPNSTFCEISATFR